MTPNRPEAGNMQMTDDTIDSIADDFRCEDGSIPAHDVLRFARSLLSASKPAAPVGWTLVPDHADADAIVTSLYRRFKDWSKRGFGPEDVTWCEVKADVLAMLASAPAAPSPAQTERGAFEAWAKDALEAHYDERESLVTYDPDSAWLAWQARAALQAAPAAETLDPRQDLGERMRLAREAGLSLRIDGKFGSNNYHSVTGSWPALIRFVDLFLKAIAVPQPAADAPGMAEPVALDMSLEARLADAEADVARLHKEKMDLWMQVHGYTEPQPAQTAQSGEPVGYRSTDPRFWNAPQPSPTAVVPDDERAAFEAWAKEALEAHYDEHDSLITYDPVSAWLAWQASRRAALEKAIAKLEQMADEESTVEYKWAAASIRALAGATET